MVKVILDYIKNLSLIEIIIFSVALTAIFVTIKCQSSIFKKAKETEEPVQDNTDNTDIQKEGFCTCQDMSSETCSKPETIQLLYNKGLLTEFTDLTKFQDTSKWKVASAYDKFYKYGKK